MTPHQTHNTTLEVLWSVIPLILCIGIFFWGLNGWMKYAVAPGEAMEISVTAKQWLWQFEYPDGSRTINDIHVPVNKPVKFTMTSEDVLHDFFVPDMRVKHDIIPGRYTQIWFTPNRARPAQFHLRRILRQGSLRHEGHADRRQRCRLRQVDGNRRHRVGGLFQREGSQEDAGGLGQDHV